jgi:single-stranded-DNA-specific exonuclease
MSKIIRRRHSEGPELAAGLHPVLQKVYALRGISAAEDLQLGLDRLLKPGQLAGLDEAASLLADCLMSGQRMVIIGDFDADGATSTAVGMILLREMGAAEVRYLVPNRFEYGYGLTPEIVALAAQDKPALIITVDNGISSIDGVAAANELGIRTLVTDHHLPGAQLPAAEVIVNPNQPDCDFPSKNLAGVGVIFYVMSALRSELRSRNWFEEQNIPEPRLADVLDLVALGTVADVVPLDHNNRVLVEQGLQRMRANRTRPGIRALLELSSRPLDRLVASDLGFALGPRLNAAGRLDDMATGIECLLSRDEATARLLARELDTLNRDRQHIEKTMQAEALQLLEDFFRDTGGVVPCALCLYDQRWHQGVVGILASRIKDRLHRPVIAFADADAGSDEVKGSARSIVGLHIRDALDRVATRYPGLVTKFGGHAMAAGLSLPRANLDRFRDMFEAEVESMLDDTDLEAVVESDGELAPADMQLDLARQLRYAGPWGQHFPEPRFDAGMRIVQQRLVGERHLKLVLQPDGGEVIDAIAFNVDLDIWPDPSVEWVRLVYRLDINQFRGRESLQLIVEYLEPT